MKTYTNIVLAIAVLASSGGCFLFDQTEDEPLGTVHVDSLLVTDTCGPGTTTGDPSMSYEVELRRSGSSLIWNAPGGSFQGVFSSDDEFCIELNAQWHVRDPDPWYDDPGCDMMRVERLCGTLTYASMGNGAEGGLEQVTALSGRHEAFFSEYSGSDCSDQIGLEAGQYLALPCQVAYTLTGVPLED